MAEKISVKNDVSDSRTQSVKLLQNENKDSEHGKKVDDDPITKAIGAIGKWQIWVCFIVFLVKFPVAWHQMSIIFLAPPTNFTCAGQDNTPNQCSANCSRYEFDRSVFKETIVTKWELVCGRSWLAEITQTIFMLGILVGNMMFGFLADRLGRRKPFLGAVILQLLAGVITAFSVNWFMFTFFRFLLAVATGGTMVTSFVLTMELIGVKYRDLVGIIYQIPFNLGHLTLPLIGYFLREWNYFQLAISLPSVIFLSYYFLLPESPRWLMTEGKTEAAVEILEKAAKRNSLPTDNISASMMKYSEEMRSTSSEQRASFPDLFRTRVLRRNTLCISFNWLVCGLCFFGVSHFMGKIGGDIFSNVAVSAAIQVPGTLFSIYANRTFGRKWTLISSNCVTALSCLLFGIVPNSNAAHIALGSAGLWGMSISFATVYLYAGELFPTVIRNTGVGFCSTVARIGSMISPFVAGLSSVGPWLPPIIFGAVALIGASLCLLLPDTRGKKLPDRLEEIENDKT